MTIFGNILYRYYRFETLKRAKAVCDHMLLVYNYLYKANPDCNSGTYIKEAVAMLDNWEPVSAHVFKHRPTATTLEIEKNDQLIDFTLKIIHIELADLVKIKNQLIKRLVKSDAERFVIDYFIQNKPHGHN